MTVELIQELPEGCVGFHAKNKVTAEDYEKVLIPAIEEAIKKFDKVSFLYHVGDEYEGYELGALWDDTKFGMTHMTHFKKIALVTDVEWLRVGCKMFGFVWHGHVKVFDNAQIDEAKAWLGE